MTTDLRARVQAEWRTWLPEGGLALTVLVIGLIEASRYDADQWPVLIGVPLAVLLARRAPGAALGIVWVVGASQILLTLPVLTMEVAVAAVAFGCARWGTTTTVVLSGLSIPAAAAMVVVLIVSDAYGYFRQLGAFRELVRIADTVGGGTLLVGAATLGGLVLLVPWLAGLVVRATVRARTSKVQQVTAEENAALAQREAMQAQEIATLREDQARLARDVHDVVGHSLAVILAQAESAQYLPDEPAQLKTTLATIATSARTSLQDVRHVLTPTSAAAPRPGGLESLVAGIRGSGQDVLVDEIGTPRPLPPELEVVAHRVLQEMLTNAVKHGVRDHPIRVERHWPGAGFERDLRLEVSNAEPTDDETTDNETQPIDTDPSRLPGQGIEGMRRRLEAVGGRLDVRRRTEPTGATFTATAWLPVRGAP